MRSSKKTVVRTTNHCEFGMKAVDACLTQMLGGAFDWNSRSVSVPYTRKGEYTVAGQKSFYPLMSDMEVTGKIHGIKVRARVQFFGIEDLNHPDAVVNQDDAKGPCFLALDLIRVVLEEGGIQPVRRAFEIDDMPPPYREQIRMVEM